MVKKVAEYIQKYHMLKNGDTVIVGVSGGADSVCLLSVLSTLRECMQLTVIAAHVNHMFRETAERDERYVIELCRKLNVGCETMHMDVQRVARESGMSFEEAGRAIRYEFFERLKRDYRADKIAVAHNLEDCSETMLFHLFRGSNMKGLGGIQPVHGDIIRPLLNVARNEIESYLLEHNIPWMEDETNASTEYARNRIRHNIMPEAEKICRGARGRMAETAEELRLAEEYLSMQTGSAYEDCCQYRDGGIFIRISKVKQLHPLIRSRLLYEALKVVADAAKDLSKVHVRELEKLCDLQAGRRIDLPYQICAHKTTDGILLRKEPEAKACVLKENNEKDGKATGTVDFTTAIALFSGTEPEDGEEIQLEVEGLGLVSARLLLNYELKNIPQKTYTKWFDYDKITKYAVFRKRMEGDYLMIDDKGSHKKLKEYFIQEKIPAYKRDDMWILADENHVIWVPGYRMSSFYKITDKTKKVLEITIGGNENGEDSCFNFGRGSR